MMSPVREFADHLRKRGLIGIAIALVTIFGSLVLPVHMALKLTSTALALLTIGSSLHLIFESLLFRFMASFETERAACEAMDEWLARTGLRPRPLEMRAISLRMMGTRRFIQYWRLFVSLTLLIGLIEILSITVGNGHA